MRDSRSREVATSRLNTYSQCHGERVGGGVHAANDSREVERINIGVATNSHPIEELPTRSWIQLI